MLWYNLYAINGLHHVSDKSITHTTHTHPNYPYQEIKQKQEQRSQVLEIQGTLRGRIHGLPTLLGIICDTKVAGSAAG